MRLHAERREHTLLALLPLVGIGFGVMLGADPISWLLTSLSHPLAPETSSTSGWSAWWRLPQVSLLGGPDCWARAGALRAGLS